MICSVCKREVEKYHNHHIDYENEIVILVCVKCHSKIHHTDIYPELKATAPEGYYGTPLGKRYVTISIEEEVFKKSKIRALINNKTFSKLVEDLIEKHC